MSDIVNITDIAIAGKHDTKEGGELMSMGIGSTYNSMLSNYKVPTIPTISVEGVRRQDALKLKEQNVAGLNAYETPSDPVVRKPDAPLEDIALTFHRQDDFSYLGQDSDIHSLDVERAITDMQKDKMLRQYQYFVGSARNVYESTQSPDGIVIPKF